MSIYAERERQIRIEGWTAEHDDAHKHCELRRAAECYEFPPVLRPIAGGPPRGWPWDLKWWKPSTDRTRELEKAGALFLAEGARQSRAQHFATAKRMLAKAIACGKKIDRMNRRPGGLPIILTSSFSRKMSVSEK